MKKTTFFTVLVSIILFSITIFVILKFFSRSNNEVIEEPIVDFFDRIQLTEYVFDDLIETSPDGKYTIYVTSNNLGMQHSKIWLVENSTQNELLLTEDKAFSYLTSPTWSPDSNKIAYVRVFPFEIYVIDKDGLNQTVLYSQAKTKAKNKFFPSIGFGGKTYLEWKDDEIIFENKFEIPESTYAINVETKKIRKANEEKSFSDFGNDIKLDVPHFSQRDKAYEKKKLGTCKETIGSAGCAVAAAAMVVKYYGGETNTVELNKLLTTNDLGYFDGCYIRWNMISNIYPGIKLKGAFFGDSNYKRLDYELSNGNPVIVGYNKVSFNDFQHWVVVVGRRKFTDPVTGVEGFKYLVNDPWATEPVERDLDYFGKKFDHMVVYERN